MDSPLPSGVDLRWEVRGENSCGEGPASPSAKFRIDRSETSAPTEAPVPNWPGGSISNPTPTFSWSPVAGATFYSLHVLTIRGEKVVLDETNIAGTSFAPVSPLPSGEELFWTVRAESRFGPGPDSPFVHFTPPVKVFLPMVLGNH